MRLQFHVREASLFIGGSGAQNQGPVLPIGYRLEGVGISAGSAGQQAKVLDRDVLSDQGP